MRFPAAYHIPSDWSEPSAIVATFGTTYQRTAAKSPLIPEHASVTFHQSAYAAGGSTSCAL
jgi:hypothetical protein